MYSRCVQKVLFTNYAWPDDKLTFCNIVLKILKNVYPKTIINNCWMRLGMISRIIPTEVNVICQSRRLRWITLTEVWTILDIMYKPNSTIVLSYIQNIDRYEKRFAIKRLVRLILQTASGYFFGFVIFAALR